MRKLKRLKFEMHVKKNKNMLYLVLNCYSNQQKSIEYLNLKVIRWIFEVADQKYEDFRFERQVFISNKVIKKY